MKAHTAPAKAVAAVGMVEDVAAVAVAVAEWVMVMDMAAITNMKVKVAREGAAAMAALAPVASASVPAVARKSPMKRASPVWGTTVRAAAGEWCGLN